MTAVNNDTSSSFYALLCHQEQAVWDRAVAEIIPLTHPVDQTATRIWFSFWPLKLSQSLLKFDDTVQVAKELELDGNYRLEEQLADSVKFLFGSRYWVKVKNAVLAYTQNGTEPESGRLENHILGLAENLAARENIPTSLLVGITTVAFMALRQMGMEAFRAASDPRRKESADPMTPEEVWKGRNRKRARNWLSRLSGKPEEYTVTFDEGKAARTFLALPGQDLSMASARDKREYASEDPRRIAGPIPAQCRSGSCGYCWVGILHGREELSEISEFEKTRLIYFGYAAGHSDQETHPVIRLACQSKCYGDVSVVIPPWNGALKGRNS